MSSTLAAYRPALSFQLFHLALCVGWNGVGLWQKAHGAQSIGPTASFAGVAGAIAIGICMVLLLGKSLDVPYLVISVVAVLMAAVAIHGGLTKDESNWPSEFWRWAGIVVNAFGVIGFLLALFASTQRRSHG